MRGKTSSQPAMFFAMDLEERVRQGHPLRPVRRAVEAILEQMSPRFDEAYADQGRPGVPPEVLLKLMLLQALYGIKSERQLIERLDTDLLFRWFCRMDPAEPVPAATAFTHNRQRFAEHDLCGRFFTAVTASAIDAGLVSDEHFSVDGTLIQSYAAMKSFVPNEQADAIEQERERKRRGRDQDPPEDPPDGNGFQPSNPDVDFRGKPRGNKTHRSPNDPEARLYRKGPGQPAVLGHLGHILTDNRSGLVLGVRLSEANGTAEREAALELVDALKRTHGLKARTLGADAGYESGGFLLGLEERGITPHVAPQRKARPGGACKPKKAERAGLGARLRNFRRRRGDPRYRVSMRRRKKVEEPFGWFKSHACLRKASVVGRWKLKQRFEMAAAALTLVRMRNLAVI